MFLCATHAQETLPGMRREGFLELEALGMGQTAGRESKLRARVMAPRRRIWRAHPTDSTTSPRHQKDKAARDRRHTERDVKVGGRD